MAENWYCQVLVLEEWSCSSFGKMKKSQHAIWSSHIVIAIQLSTTRQQLGSLWAGWQQWVVFLGHQVIQYAWFCGRCAPSQSENLPVYLYHAKEFFTCKELLTAFYFKYIASFTDLTVQWRLLDNLHTPLRRLTLLKAGEQKENIILHLCWKTYWVYSWRQRATAHSLHF